MGGLLTSAATVYVPVPRALLAAALALGALALLAGSALYALRHRPAHALVWP